MKNITLEMSLKPFRQTDDASLRAAASALFAQWRPLVREVPVVSVLLWTADGSEILDYRGDPDGAFDWARYVGGANVREDWNRRLDPERKGLHSRSYLYTEKPPAMTYRTLSRVVAAIRASGTEELPGKTIRVGATFDPGPEFARSSFKYERHNEICTSATMGKTSFVCAYARLHADDTAYAGFPDGIPEGTPFGTFFGRQCRHFLTDLGFDYLWLSNGLGFGRDTWSTTGALFDGKSFSGEAIPEIRREVMDFWTRFRRECPDFPVETRGTNLSAGIDMATDGVPLAAIYDGGFGILPPPNSPWAAIDGDFALELMGHLSRIAALPPEEEYLFRYYLHDPWWANSPWYDRYNRQPHDVYLPLALSRLDAAGRACPPTHMALLSVDNSWGQLPAACADEVIPHLRRAVREAPDAPAPLVWVYPFREIADSASAAELRRAFSGDWFVRDAIAEGLPLACVVSTDNFLGHDPSLYGASVLLTPVPPAGSAVEAALLAYVRGGGAVIFYGAPGGASAAFLSYFGLAADAAPLEGELPVTVNGADAGVLLHDPLLSDGPLDTRDTAGEGFAFAGGRVIAKQAGAAVWLRSTVSASWAPGQRRLKQHDAARFFRAESLTLEAFSRLGWQIAYRRAPGVDAPVTTWHRADGALIFSAYHPSTTVETFLRFPLGAPILDGYEAELRGGAAVYHFPKAERRECRVFVEQADGIVGVRELPPVSAEFRRRIEVRGLRDATVRLFGESYCRDALTVCLNGAPDWYFVGDDWEGGYKTDRFGTYLEARHITGTLVFSMPFRDNRRIEE